MLQGDSVSRKIISAYFIAFLLSMSLFTADAAKYCYSGQNNGAKSKQCSQGGTDIEYTCQKFVCEGGRSPFTLRTCARKNMGCLAGPRICQFSGGHGSCSRCDNDNSPFISRYCSDPVEAQPNPCEASMRMCMENFGNGTCYTCNNDLCNHAISVDQLMSISVFILILFSLYF